MADTNHGLTSVPDDALNGIAGGELTNRQKLKLEKWVDSAMAKGMTFGEMVDYYKPKIEEEGMDLDEAVAYMRTSWWEY